MKPASFVFNLNIAPWVVLAFSLVITLLLWRAEEKTFADRAEARFHEQTKEIESAIEARLRNYELMLRGCVGLFNASDSVARDEWKAYVQALDPNNNYPGIQGIGFAKRVSGADKEAHIRQLRAEGFPEYTIWPPGDRAEYFPTIYLEPFSGRNLRAFSYDMFSEQVRRTAMEEARDRGTTTISGKVTLVQETTQGIQHGFLMYVPVYEKNRSVATVQDRRAALGGFAYSPFRVNDFMRGISMHDTDFIAWDVYDGNEVNVEAVMYRSHDSATHLFDDARPLYAKNTTRELFGKTWTFYFKTLPPFEATIDRTRLLVIVCFSLLVSFLLFAITFLVVARSKMFAAEIIRRERDQKALRQSEKRFRDIANASADWIWEINPDGNYTFASESVRDVLGYEPEEILGRSPFDLMPPDKAERARQEFKAIVDRREPFRDLENDNLHKNGSVRHILTSGVPVIDDQGFLRGYRGVDKDITKRKQAEEKLRSALRENEVLLDEIHHRVKNNMQVIIGILSLQGESVEHEDLRRVIQNCNERINAMALVHDKLFGLGKFAEIDMRQYLIELVHALYDIYHQDMQQIQLETDIAPLQLQVGTVIPLGLVINEIVANSFKHAFPGNRQGRIRISLQRAAEQEFLLMVGDDGIGMPAHNDPKKLSSLGLRLITGMVQKQMKGTLAIDNADGTHYRIGFRVQG